jgi:hypothetical protein
MRRLRADACLRGCKLEDTGRVASICIHTHILWLQGNDVAFCNRAWQVRAAASPFGLNIPSGLASWKQASGHEPSHTLGSSRYIGLTWQKLYSHGCVRARIRQDPCWPYGFKGRYVCEASQRYGNETSGPPIELYTASRPGKSTIQIELWTLTLGREKINSLLVGWCIWTNIFPVAY